MNEGARYVKLIEWSDEDQCFIGSYPKLSFRPWLEKVNGDV